MVKLTYEDLEFDEDFTSERAEELGLFQLRLELPKGLRVTGFNFDNRLLIRKDNYGDIKQEGGNSSQP